MLVFRNKKIRCQSGQSLIETLTGFIVLIPLALFSFDLTCILVSSQNNERVAENAARAAANRPTALAAQQAAQQAVDDFNQANGKDSVSLANFTYDDDNGQVVLITQMEVKLPVPLASWSKTIVSARSILPIVALPAPI